MRIESEELQLNLEVDYEARWIPAEGDGWNDPFYPAHWEIEINSVYQLDDHDEPCGIALKLTDKFVDALLVYAEEDVDEHYETPAMARAIEAEERRG